MVIKGHIEHLPEGHNTKEIKKVQKVLELHVHGFAEGVSREIQGRSREVQERRRRSRKVPNSLLFQSPTNI